MTTKKIPAITKPTTISPTFRSTFFSSSPRFSSCSTLAGSLPSSAARRGSGATKNPRQEGDQLTRAIAIYQNNTAMQGKPLYAGSNARTITLPANGPAVWSFFTNAAAIVCCWLFQAATFPMRGHSRAGGGDHFAFGFVGVNHNNLMRLVIMPWHSPPQIKTYCGFVLCAAEHSIESSVNLISKRRQHAIFLDFVRHTSNETANSEAGRCWQMRHSPQCLTIPRRLCQNKQAAQVLSTPKRL